MREFDSEGRRVRRFAPKLTARWIRENVRPNIAFTGTLLQNRRLEAWRTGDANEYEWAFSKIIHRLSEQHLGKAYRRKRKLIPSFAALEGDGDVKRKHLHAGLRCPDHVEFNHFMGSLYYACARSAWMMDDVKIEPITDDWAGYSLKEGSEALLVGSISF